MKENKHSRARTNEMKKKKQKKTVCIYKIANEKICNMQ